MSSKRPTSRDVARQAGVSVATVSRTITRPEDVNEETREHVLSVMRQMGYRANRAAADLRRGSSKTLLVLVSDITNAFFSEFFKGIEEEARQHGYVVLIGDTSEVASNERVYSNMLLMNQAGGLILNTYDFPADLMPTNGDGSYKGPPLVSCAGHKDVDVPSVRTDDALGGRLAAEHLIELGHKDIIQICGPLQVHGFERRYFGFRQALKQAGIDIQEERARVGLLSVQFGIDAAHRLVDEGSLPTAVFVHNDETATGFLHGLANRGIRVPDDISVVGYDDMPYAAVFNPGLTTVHLPRRRWGQLACQKLISVLENDKNASQPVIIPPTLVPRASTAAPRR
ncbi:LacI family DNA-binding transcriptional regulator [Roseibium porphyridii]|uniref:LacI family DNA-binding transcriptional regulator n=1 Tax=Roseibium porphyridii TaxID=2866279 RepID=A0ABY8F6V1_9HYPH|nr:MULTISPECIES: LacI family DNA-binding transcriptional regulator [Stappiaceae]QFT30586.1 HTH-type transcriptional repressor CytR [Labrenzia sp. THAF82]WFE91223.1 LacI family DNA-binding transcriptional regulator [Roseibium sp. KMA01]